ncbi:MAG: rod shape-determining protein RodA [Ignavibacteriae bacterium]|nr:rod shape-determining protein RodA [Ignavibacteriota bacterium]MCB9214446.1 rod shape-determining protein RodA [Ignavibacteria bacterium]
MATTYRNGTDRIGFESEGGNVLTFDFRTFLVSIALVAIGLISLYSATYDAGASEMFKSQLIFALLGLGVMLAVAFLPERWIRVSAWPSYGVALLLLALVMVVGREINGAKAWIVLGPISLQPSELAKIASLMAAAFFISREGRELTNWRDLGITGAIIGLPMLVVFKEDLGSATVFGALLLGVLLWAGADLFLLFALVAPVIVAVVALWSSTAMYVTLGLILVAMISFRRSVVVTAIGFALSVVIGFTTPILFQKLPEYQRVRIEVLYDQSNIDPRGYGYNLIQSMLAIGSGGVTGKGFLQGTQTQLRYVPEQYTDFIFSVTAEEFGFLGAILVIFLLTLLVWFAVDTAFRLRDKFESTLCFGIGVIFFYHTLVNIGMTVGLAPVIGIPLSFMSKGGSSLLVNMAMVGLLLNFYRFRTDVRRI